MKTSSLELTPGINFSQLHPATPADAYEGFISSVMGKGKGQASVAIYVDGELKGKAHNALNSSSMGGAMCFYDSVATGGDGFKKFDVHPQWAFAAITYEASRDTESLIRIEMSISGNISEGEVNSPVGQEWAATWFNLVPELRALFPVGNLVDVDDIIRASDSGANGHYVVTQTKSPGNISLTLEFNTADVILPAG
jgi:hypothetical protein